MLASRSGGVVRDGQGLSAQLESLGACAEVAACDSGEPRDTGALVGRGHPLAGVLHAAGALQDRMLRFMTCMQLRVPFSAKAVCASQLLVTARTPLQLAVLFSSTAAVLGNWGQANYASANAYLDTVALCTRREGCVASSLQIPAVSGAGMGASTFSAVC